MASLGDLFVVVGAKIDGFKQAMTDVSSTLDSTTTKATAATSIINKMLGGITFAAVGTAAFQMAGAFEDASVRIQRSTGATGADLEGLNKSFGALYAGSAQSAVAISTAMVKIAQKTGATGAALESLTKSALNFAKVTGSDVVSSVAANEKVFAAWGITISEQSRALDAMYVASQKTGISTEQLSQSMLTMGPALRNMGFGFNESIALISSFEKAGLNADDMVRGLNVVFAKMAVAGKDPKEALTDLIERMGAAANRATALNLAVDAGFTAKTAGKFVDAVRSGAFELKILTELLDKSAGKVDEMAKKSVTFGEEFAKMGNVIAEATQQSGLLEWLTKVIAKFNEATPKGSAFMKAMATQASGKFAGEALPMRVAMGLTENKTLSESGFPVETPTGAFGEPGGAATGTGGGLAAGDKTHPWDQITDSLAVLIAAYHDATSAHKATIEEIAKSGLTIPAYWEDLRNKAAMSALAFDDLGNAVAPQKSIFEALGPSIAKCDVIIKELNKDVVTAAQEALRTSPFGQLAEGAKYFGITTRAEYEKTAKESETRYHEMKDSGLASDRELTIAYLQMLDDMANADRAFGRISDEEWQKITTDIKAQLDKVTGAHTASANTRRATERTLGEDIQAINRKTFDSIERGLADSVVNFKTFGKTFGALWTTLWQGLAKDALSIMFKTLLDPLEKAIGKVLGGIFKVPPAGPSVPNVPGIPSGGGAGGAVGAVSGGLTGILTSVFTGISAVSGVVGNFQNARMETTLNAIEESTRYLKIGLVTQGDSLLNDSHVIRNTLTDFMAWNWNVATTYFQGISEKLDTIISKGGFGQSATAAIPKTAAVVAAGVAGVPGAPGVPGEAAPGLGTDATLSIFDRLVQSFVDNGIKPAVARVDAALDLSHGFMSGFATMMNANLDHIAAAAGGGGSINVNMNGVTIHGASKETVGEIATEMVRQIRQSDVRRKF